LELAACQLALASRVLPVLYLAWIGNYRLSCPDHPRDYERDLLKCCDIVRPGCTHRRRRRMRLR